MSVRTLKRWFRRLRAYRKARPELLARRGRLEATFGGPVTWRRMGGRGRDVVCLILRGGRAAGVLRLVNPDTPGSTPPEAGLPFVSLDAAGKLSREWDAYTAGHPLGLAPRPLWRDARAMLCEYVDALPLDRIAEMERKSLLDIAAEALSAISRLHAAGISHMDMSLSNILMSEGRHLFVDFEYGPAAGLSFEQQCLYDYLRLLESFWKLLGPAERAAAPERWGRKFLDVAPAAVRAADRAPLRPALGRTLAAPELRKFFDAFG